MASRVLDTVLPRAEYKALAKLSREELRAGVEELVGSPRFLSLVGVIFGVVGFVEVFSLGFFHPAFIIHGFINLGVGFYLWLRGWSLVEDEEEEPEPEKDEDLEKWKERVEERLNLLASKVFGIDEGA